MALLCRWGSWHQLPSISLSLEQTRPELLRSPMLHVNHMQNSWRGSVGEGLEVELRVCWQGVNEAISTAVEALVWRAQDLVLCLCLLHGVVEVTHLLAFGE